MTAATRPGARIVETRVAREFGTSQAPVREALRDLEALGVVEITRLPWRSRPPAQRRGAAGGLRRPRRARDARRRAGSPSRPDRTTTSASWRATSTRCARRREAGDPYAEAAADAAFHGYIMQLAGNATLERVWRTLEPFLRTYITIVVAGRRPPRRSRTAHAPSSMPCARATPTLVQRGRRAPLRAGRAMLAARLAGPARPSRSPRRASPDGPHAGQRRCQHDPVPRKETWTATCD